MGNYKRITQLLERSVPDYTNLQIVPRGTPIFPDLLMTGQMRFARRTGANLAVLNPDNQIKLTTDALVATQILSVTRVLDWIEQDSLITFNGTEMLQVEDFDPDMNRIFLKAPLGTARVSGSKLTLWATPLQIHLPANPGDVQITVRSRYHLLNGDAVTLPVSSEISSLKQISVELATYAGDSLDPVYPFLYVLTLQEALPVELLSASRLFLRAFPGYLSNQIRVPKLKQGQMGPFLLDFMASPLDSVASYPEIFSIRTYDGNGTAVQGTAGALLTTTRNHPIVERPIWGENILFWQVIRGSGGFTYPNRYRLLCDAAGQARVQTKLVPEFPTGQTYRFRVKAGGNGLFRIYRGETLGYQDFTLVANTLTPIDVTTPPGATFDRMEFIFDLDTAGAEIQILDSEVIGATVATFQYGYVFRVVGETNFQASSVIVKPYFLSLADLTARYDQENTYNSGSLYL